MRADFGGDDIARLIRGALVIFLHKAHDVDAVLAERRTNRLCGRRLTRGELQCEHCLDTLGQFLLL